MRELDGPRLEVRGRSADALVVLIHGYGASGDDLIALGDAWRRYLPAAAFVAPHAPEPLEMSGGYQWFPLTMRDPGEYWQGAVRAGPVLQAFVDKELQRLRLPARRLALVGFSQGTMLALHVGPRSTTAPAAIVGYAGLLAGVEHLKRDTRARPPVLLIHGEADDVIPVDALHLTREAMAAAGFAVEWHVRPGLAHGIDETGLALGGHFLRQHLL